VLQTVSLRAALDVFDRVRDLDALFAKSRALTALMERALRALVPPGVVALNAEPAAPQSPAEHAASRGCQVSLRFPARLPVRRVHERLARRGVVTDLREPDVIRAAPVPLYNSFRDVVEFALALGEAVREVHAEVMASSSL